MDDVLIKFRSDLSDIKKDLDVVKGKLNATEKAGKEAGKTTEKSFKEADNAATKLEKGVKGVGTALVAAFSVQAVISFGKAVFAITAEFQKFRAVLTNTLGSGSEADAVLKRIAKFASETPFSVQELTSSFVKLANQGFKPTNDELRKLGDLASSTGKGFDQLTEAIIDAQTGEFERLKEFGIRASKEGDNVNFSFKGVETQTKFTADAIREYLLSLGDLQGVSGASEAISKTLGGQISNLGDNFDRLLLTIGDATEGMAGGFIDAVTSSITVLTYLLGGIEDNTEAVDEFGKSLKSLSVSQKQVLQFSIANLEAQLKQVEAAGNYGNAVQDLNKLIDEQKKQLAQLEAAEESENDTKEKSIKTDKEKAKSLKDIEIIRKRTLKDFQKDRLKAIDDANKEEEAANKKLNEQLNSDDTKARLEQGQKDMDIQRKTYEADVDGNKKANEEKERQDEQYRQASFMVAQSIADAALELNRRTREAETDDKIKSLEKQRDAELNYRGATEADKSRINAEFDEKRKKILRDNFEAQKRASIIEANIQGALAVIAALPNYVLAAAVGVTTGIQLALIASQPTPEFHTGGVDINPKRKNKKGEFDAKLIEGESVVHAKATKQWKNELKAMNEMKFEDYVLSKYVVPALRVQQQEVLKHQNNSLARNMANSIMLNQGFNDGNIVEMLKRVNSSTKENSKILSKGFRSKRTHLRG